MIHFLARLGIAAAALALSGTKFYKDTDLH